MTRHLLAPILAIFMSLGIISCASSARTSSDMQTNRVSNTATDSTSNSSDATNRSVGRNDSSTENRAGGITQNETRTDHGATNGSSESTVTYTREFVDAEGKVTHRDIVQVDSNVVSSAASNSNDARDQGGNFTGTRTDSSAINAATNSARGSGATTGATSDSEQTARTETDSKGSGGLSIWFWIILGVAIAVCIAMWVYNRSLVGRVTRFATYLGSVGSNAIDEATYTATLNAKDRELVRRRKND